MANTNASSSPPSTETPPPVAAPQQEQQAPPNHPPSVATRNAAAAEAHDRAVRFGLVFTQLGAASKEEVFPHGVRHMPRLLTLKEVTEGRLKRQSLEELDAKIRKGRSWWWPFGWFGPPSAEEVEIRQREAQRKADDALRKRQLKLAMDKAVQAEEARKLEDLESQSKPVELVQEQAVVAPEPIVKPKRYPLKVEINTRGLTAAEEASLTTSVANQRLGILESEKQVHSMMDTIEKTRMQYLRISEKGIKCERELVAVLQCYEEAKYKAQAHNNRAAALKCGPSVDALELCAVEIAKAHIRE